jgi:hypothetical protein
MLDRQSRRQIRRAVQIGLPEHRVVRLLKSAAFWTTFVTAAATATIAIATIFYTKYAKRQWTAMDGQLGEMQDARRPWVGLNGNVQVREKPLFHVMPINDQLSVAISYTTHNFGTSPAFRETNAFVLLANERPTGPPVSAMQHLCANEEDLYRANSASLTAIFPAEELDQGLWYPAMIPKTTRYVRQVWFIGCFVYADSAARLHHTKYWFVSPPSTDRVPAAGAENELSWAPFSSLVLDHIEAD